MKQKNQIQNEDINKKNVNFQVFSIRVLWFIDRSIRSFANDKINLQFLLSLTMGRDKRASERKK